MAADTNRRAMDFTSGTPVSSGTWVNCRPVRSAGTPVPEYNDWVYADKYDAQSEAGNIIGSQALLRWRA